MAHSPLLPPPSHSGTRDSATLCGAAAHGSLVLPAAGQRAGGGAAEAGFCPGGRESNAAQEVSGLVYQGLGDYSQRCTFHEL